MKIANILMAVIFTCVFGFSTIPGEVYAKSGSKGAVAEETVKAIPVSLDINSADKELLMRLPGIGSKTADAIIKYRTANGQFKSIDDLAGVKGIGDKKLAKLKPFLKKV